MKLKNSLYSVVGGSAASGYRIALQAGHPIYRAHFPGEPITPGVCIIQTAVELLEECRQHPLVLSAVKSVKYLSVISPVETPEVTYVFDSIEPCGDHTVKAQVTVADGDRPLVKISMTCSEQPA